MASASDYDFVDFSVEAPADLNHYLCNSGSFSKLFTTGKDYAWCLEYARDRHAAATDLSVNHVTKTPYSKAISSANWNKLLTDWIDLALDSGRFVQSLGDWEHGDIVNQSGIIANLVAWTRAAFYASGRPEFAAGERLDDTKIAAFENLLLKLIYFWRPYNIYICTDPTDYTEDIIAYYGDGSGFTAYQQQGILYEHRVEFWYTHSGRGGGEYKAYLNSWSTRLTNFSRYNNVATHMESGGFKRLWVFRVTKVYYPNWDGVTKTEQERYVVIDRLQISGGLSGAELAAVIINAAGMADDITYPCKTEEEFDAWRETHGYASYWGGDAWVIVRLVEALDLGRISKRVEELA